MVGVGWEPLHPEEAHFGVGVGVGAGTWQILHSCAALELFG